MVAQAQAAQMQAPSLADAALGGAGARELGPGGLPPLAYPGSILPMPALEALLRTAPEVKPARTRGPSSALLWWQEFSVHVFIQLAAVRAS